MRVKANEADTNKVFLNYVRDIDRVYPMEFGVTEVAFRTREEFDGYARDSFRNEQSIRRVVFPEGMTEIPDGYFFRCHNLESVVLPSTILKIGSYAFYECTSLKEILLPSGLIEIGEFGFGGCEKLRTVYIPQSVTSIGNAAFSGCTDLASLQFGYGAEVTSLGSHALQFCKELTGFVLPDKMETLKTAVFYDCRKIHSIRVPESVTRVEINAFFNSKLKEVIFTNGETILVPGALHGLPEGGAVLIKEGIGIVIPNVPYEEEISILDLIEREKDKD